MTHGISFMGLTALVSAGLAALILLDHLARRPALDAITRLRLLLGLGLLPAVAAAATTAEGMNRTTERTFCGSCHVMEAHLADVMNPESTSLAARHGRNAFSGESNCYICHANYGMLGYPLTKLTGMKHVYYYYLGGYRQMPLEQAVRDIVIEKPFPNSNCMQCHSGQLESFRGVREHTALQEDLESNKVACASAGCHGYSHPFSKEAREKAGLQVETHR